MNNSDFDLLCQSIREAGEIQKGICQPRRVDGPSTQVEIPVKRELQTILVDGGISVGQVTALPSK